MAASKKILDFFTPEMIMKLTGYKELTIDLSDESSKWKFRNREVDELQVETLGQGIYSDAIGALTRRVKFET